jgi:DNA-binding GntR family transcriptional regulator
MSEEIASEPATRGEAATHAVHDLLRQKILEGELAPGEEISQLDLTRRLGVGRTPLREALRLLQREGLVIDVGSHRRVRISALSMADLDDLYSLRVLGEGLAIWLTVPTLRGDDFEQLTRDSEAVAAGDAEAHRRFHAVLRRGAGDRLSEHLRRLFEHAERYQWAFLHHGVSSTDGKLAEHLEIVEACRAGDRERARALLVDHIADTAVSLMTVERHAPFSLPIAVDMAKAGFRISSS